jgi:hypothetical protein
MPASVLQDPNPIARLNSSRKPTALFHPGLEIPLGNQIARLAVGYDVHDPLVSARPGLDLEFCLEGLGVRGIDGAEAGEAFSKAVAETEDSEL